MRIIAGKHKGRRLELWHDLSGVVRPTSERARESVFNILTHSPHAPPLPGARALDVCCGSGAFGFEALSRGAAFATFIDQSREALRRVTANAERFGEAGTVEVIAADATQLPTARAPHSLVFVDPPYGKNLLPPVLASLLRGGWIAPDALIVTESDEKDRFAPPPSFMLLDERRYGRAVISLLRLADDADISGALTARA